MSFILRYDSSTIPFTHLKCTIQWFSVYVLSFATIDSHFSKHFFRVNVCLWVNARPPIHTGIKLAQFGDLTFSGMHMWFIPGLRSMWKVVISGSLCLLRYSSPGANWKDRVAFMGAIVCRSYTPFYSPSLIYGSNYQPFTASMLLLERTVYPGQEQPQTLSLFPEFLSSSGC